MCSVSSGGSSGNSSGAASNTASSSNSGDEQEEAHKTVAAALSADKYNQARSLLEQLVAATAQVPRLDNVALAMEEVTRLIRQMEQLLGRVE